MSLGALSTDSRTIVLFGASGQFGSSLACALRGREVLRFAWSEDSAFLETVLSSLRPARAYDLVFAGGVTNPTLPEGHIRRSNILFPQKFIEVTGSHPSYRYLTLGTVMENFPVACANNPYLRSKLDLGHWLLDQARRPQFAGRIRHVRLHTIYGGEERKFLKPHMFLGQLAEALQAGIEFKMSSGDQLREYHHTEDVALSLKGVLERNWEREAESSILQINSGAPIRLGDLAIRIFRAFGREHLLKLGAIPRARGENLDRVFPRSETWLLPASREPIAGVTAWLRLLLK